MFKKIEIWILLLVCFFGFIFTIFFAWNTKQAVLSEFNPEIKPRFENFANFTNFLVSIPTNIKLYLSNNDGGDIEVIDYFSNKKSGFNGKALDFKAYILVSRYDGDIKRSIVELIDLTNFNSVHKWLPKIDEINSMIDTSNPEFQSTMRDRSVNRYLIYHPLMTNDGGLIFKDYSPLVKVDSCGSPVWINQSDRFHHSSMINDEGKIFVPTHIFPFEIEKKYVGDKISNYYDDGIAILSPDGNTIFSKSVSNILIENGLKYLLFSVETGHGLPMPRTHDPIHLNDIEPVNQDGPFWKKGDVFLSLRHQSMIILYRPSTNKILKTLKGPFSHQHDVNIINDHQISIFNNRSINIYNGNKIEDGYSEVLIYDFKLDETSSYLKNSFIENNIFTSRGGRSKILNNKDLIVETDDQGSIFYIAKNGKLIWHYLNKANNGNVYKTNWHRIYTNPDEITMIENFLKRKRTCSE